MWTLKRKKGRIEEGKRMRKEGRKDGRGRRKEERKSRGMEISSRGSIFTAVSIGAAISLPM